MAYDNMKNWETKPVICVGDGEYAIPNTHCGGYEVTYWEKWNGQRAEYRCDNCGQRFRLRHTPGYERPYSLYD
jgi:predicted RNA-binding Zn-ribbon protein involved in translation (DUF1610 family)